MNYFILGSYGYRGPGSDYGGRGGSSIHGDSDDASETSSICSERAYEVCKDCLRSALTQMIFVPFIRMFLIFYVEYPVVNGLKEKKVLLV